MVLFKIPGLSALALAFAIASPAFACVDFSWNQYNFVMNAGLTDNGVQVCSIVNVRNNGREDGIRMNCIPGYSAYIRYGGSGQTIEYAYGSFSGEFTCQWATPVTVGGNGGYCNARVWGC
jgi:hypothetical protein